MHTWIYLWFLSFCINIWFTWIVENPCQSTTTSRPLRLSSPKTPTSRAYRVEGMGHKEDGTRGWQLWMDPVNFFLGWDWYFCKIAKDWNIHDSNDLNLMDHFDSLPYKEVFITQVRCGWFLLFGIDLALYPGTRSVVEKNGLVSPIVRLRCSRLLVVGCLLFFLGCSKRWITLTTGCVVKWWSRLGYSEKMTMEGFVGEMLDFYHSLFVADTLEVCLMKLVDALSRACRPFEKIPFYL